ncbi:L-2-amino-thiazoline-4-carboxylic acid hydrolase [Streptomyces xiamenensis]
MSEQSHPAELPSPSRAEADRECGTLIEAFQERLGRELATLGVDADTLATLRDRMRALARELADGDAQPAPDEPARVNRRYAAAVLAAHRVLSATSAPGVPAGSGLLELLTTAFAEPFGPALTEGVRALLDAAPDPFATMVTVARTREETDFGAEFTFTHPRDDSRAFFADVVRCGYHDWLTERGAGELTPVLCAFDGNWIRAIDPERHGFAFTRTTTIGEGGTHCPFHFRRTTE